MEEPSRDPENMAPPETPAPPKPPLGLPVGSVRAILALLLSGTLWSMILRGLPPPTILI